MKGDYAIKLVVCTQEDNKIVFNYYYLKNNEFIKSELCNNYFGTFELEESEIQNYYESNNIKNKVLDFIKNTKNIMKNGVAITFDCFGPGRSKMFVIY